MSESRIELKSAGKALIASALALALLYAVFMDLVILLASLAAFLMLLYALASVRSRVGWLIRNCRVNPEAVNVRLIAGTAENVRVRVEAPMEVRVSVMCPLGFCRVDPRSYATNGELVIRVAPKMAGEYSSDGLTLGFYSPLKAFWAEVYIPFRMSVSVIPRVVPAAVRAFELLASASPGRLAYEFPLPLLGAGTEYAETRIYLPGDDLRRVDWKATARLQRLMVKEFHQEAGGAVNLVYDLKAAGPVSRDVAATEFLNVAVALSEQNRSYWITVVDEEGNMRRLRFRGWRENLLMAVRIALSAVEVDYTYLYELMRPHAFREALMLLRVVDEGFPISEEGLTPGDEVSDSLVVSCLLGDLTWLMGVYEDVNAGGGSLVVYVPSGVWLDSPSLERAYVDYRRQARLISLLRRMGITVRVCR